MSSSTAARRAGSAYHYFPGGRTQLLCEAVDYAGESHRRPDRERRNRSRRARRRRRRLPQAVDRDRLPRRLPRGGRRASRRATPTSTRTHAGHRARGGGVRALDRPDRRHAWSPTALRPTRARELAMLITAAIEGAIVVARASRDLEALDVVHRQLRTLLQAETSERKSAQMTAMNGSRPPASCASATAASSCRSTAASWSRSAATRSIPRRRATRATRRCGSTTTRTTATG